MTLTRNHFELFGLPVTYSIDLTVLAERYLQLQRQFHPDRYANKPAQEQRLAVEYTADLNQAHTTLKSPLARAQYLLSLAGVESSGETTVTADVAFLVQQMELREALAEVQDLDDPLTALDEMSHQAQSHYDELQAEFGELYCEQDYETALTTIAKMQFYSKLLAEIQDREQDFEEV